MIAQRYFEIWVCGKVLHATSLSHLHSNHAQMHACVHTPIHTCIVFTHVFDALTHLRRVHVSLHLCVVCNHFGRLAASLGDYEVFTCGEMDQLLLLPKQNPGVLQS